MSIFRTYAPYIEALAASALALGVTVVFRGAVDPIPLLPCLLAIVISGWRGGLGPGLLSTGLTTAGVLLIYPPGVHPVFAGTAGGLRLAGYALTGVLISRMNGAVRSAQAKAEQRLARLQESEREREELFLSEQRLRQEAEERRQVADGQAESLQLAHEELQSQHEELQQVEEELRIQQDELRQAYEDLTRQRRHLTFLLEASITLASTLDVESTLQEVSRLAVPTIASACFIDLVDDEPVGSQRLRRVALVLEPDPRSEQIRALSERYPPDINAAFGSAVVVRSKQPVLYSEITDAVRIAAARDAEHLRLLREIGVTSYLAVPLLVDERLLGVIGFFSLDPNRTFGAEDVSLASDLARRCGLAVERHRLYQRVEAALADREAALRLHQELERGLTLLVEGSASLLGSLELDEVLSRLITISQTLIPADAYAVWRLPAGGDAWEMAASSGLSEGYQQGALRPVESHQLPQDPVAIPDVRAALLVKERQEGYRREGIESLLVLPLRIRGELRGTITLYFRQPHHFSELELRIGAALANLASAAVGTSELYEEQREMRAGAEAARWQASLVAEASEIVSSSLDWEQTLAAVAQFMVPALADWCSVHVVEEDGALRQLAVAHTDPAKVRWVHELQRRYPARQDSPYGAPAVARSGRSEMMAEIPPEVLEQAAQDDEHLELIRSLQLRSYIVVPLKARERILGTITLVHAESGRSYTGQDLELAEELARRAALALDNARLFRNLQEADRTKDEFLAMLAHELRNPLAAIRNSLELIRLRQLPHDVLHDEREVLERQIAHMGRLLDDLLDVSRITRGKIELRIQPAELGGVVHHAIQDARPLIDARGHTLHVELPDAPIRVRVDATRIEQVVANLLTNAAKYTEPGGEIWVRVTPEDRWVAISVRDTGVGITADDLPRIFELFVQTERPLDRTQGGLGIGLTLVRTLVEMHGGEVSAHSDGPGKGSEFVVRLPAGEQVALAGALEPPVTESRHAEDPSATAPEPGARRILVVDDNQDSADTLAEILEMWGAEVRVVYDGQSALAVAREFAPQVVLLDIGLPGMDGYAVARQLREREAETGSGLRLVALTGYGQQRDRDRSREAGFDYHLVKPVEFSALARILEA
ncbi:MAG: GAF domain-containing protein [Armatimonadota bacterium]